MFTERRVKFNLGRTINLGNFESVRVDYGEEVTVDEGIDMDEARTALKFVVKEQLEKEVEKLTPKKNSLPRGKAFNDGYVP